MTNIRVFRMEPAFYVSMEGPEYVFQEWDEEDAPYSVVRNGALEINVRLSEASEWVTLTSTQQLFDFGIDFDDDLLALENDGRGLFEWVSNPWFEIVDENQEPQSWGEIAANVFNNLDDAEKACMEMNEQYRKENA